MGVFLIDPRCIKQREICNIPSWHEHGYLGEGLVIFHDDLGDTSHNDCCVDIMQVILPKAKIYSGSIGSRTVGGKIVECTIKCNETGEYMPFEDFIVKYKVNQINNSTTVQTKIDTEFVTKLELQVEVSKQLFVEKELEVL